MDLGTRTIFISRDVIFHETIFPFGTAKPTVADPFISEINSTFEGCLGPFVTPYSVPDMHNDQSASYSDITPSLSSVPISTHHVPLPDSLPFDSTSVLLDSIPFVSTNLAADDQSLIKSTRVHRPPTYLQDYACNAASSSSLASAATHPPRSPYDLSACLTYCHLDPQYKSYLMTVSQGHSTSQYFSQAVQDPLWRAAINKEIQAFEATQTWVLTPLPSGKRTIGCKWVYRVKLNPDDNVERYKARLVAKGYTQREGLDFLETFSPVAKTVSVRVLIALASAQKWPLHQLDINNAFFHGDLEEEVYMDLPPGYHNKGKCTSSVPMVCKLVKSLYDLKQASRQWNAKLSATISTLGFKQSQADHSLFVHSSGSNFTALLIYVNDMIITGNDVACVVNLKQVLDQKFGIKDLGSLKYFLGL